ncbi:unnamed protein product, partial [Staurois parvus]
IFLLQCPRQCPPADSGFRSLRRQDVRGTEPAGNLKMSKIKLHSITFLYQTISHTFCPECFVLCPACIFTVSA